MDISGIFGSADQAALFETLFEEKSKNVSGEEYGGSRSSNGYDTVSISAEAKEILLALSSAAPEKENAQQQAAAESSSASGGGGNSSSSESGSKVQSLKSKLSQLQAMLGQTTDEEAAGINAQISEVMSELAALQSQTA